MIGAAAKPYWLAILLSSGCAGTQPIATPNASAASGASPQAGEKTAPAQEHVCPCKLQAQAAQSPPQQCTGSSDGSCFVFATPASALAQVLSEQPQILAIGETHILAQHQNVRSTTARFREELLPQLKYFRALILETLIPAAGCDEEQARVREQTKEVTAPQAKTNPNEFLQLAARSKELGVTPYPLRLSCPELKAIAASGEQGAEESLRFIATKTIERARALLAEQQLPLLTYGGAMHNDLAPAPDRQAWSFGPTLSSIKAETGELRYVELDLITRELIQDRAPWTSLAWYPSFALTCETDGTLLIRQGEHSFALIFPWQSSTHPPCPTR